MSFASYPSNLDLTKQSIEIPGTRKEGQTGVWKGAIFDRSILTAPNEPRTLFELFEKTVKAYPDRHLFLHRTIHPSSTLENPQWTADIVSTTYSQTKIRRDRIGSALLSLEREGKLCNPASQEVSPPEIKHPGVPVFGDNNRTKGNARRGWAVGVWSKNREEWQLVDLACQAYGLVGVSLYETLGPDVAQYITNHCPLPIIIAAATHIPALLKIAPSCPSLRVVVSMDPMAPTEKSLLGQWASTLGIELMTLEELEQKGTGANAIAPGPEHGEDMLDRKRIATISYTSGTTGNPKGVVLTTENLVSAVISNGKGLNTSVLNQPWVFLSFLPLSHIYERFVEILIMYGGGTIAFSTGDATRLLEDAQIFQPHFFVGVPRIWNRIHAAIVGQMKAGGLKGALLTKAVNTKLARWKETGEVTHPIYDALVFRKIRNLMGGRLVFMTSGAAPLRPDVQEILTICFSCNVIQGFGMTETVGTCSVGITGDNGSPGTCGRVQPCNNLKLISVPDMGYTAEDKPNPRGEVCLQGLNIFPGYLHNPKATKESIDEEGWFHTGDIGEIDHAGRLKIIDRLKNVVKLSQGEYVALEKIEGIYALDPLFASFLVHGDPTRSYLIALAALDPVQAALLVNKVLGKDIKSDDVQILEQLVQDSNVRMAVLRKLAVTAKQNKLNGFEHIKGLHLTLKPFSEEIITPTFKFKRNIAAKIYSNEIEGAYRRGPQEAANARKGAKL
ncbi:hypothetical protein L204_100689 [Cryptococcus depauperatus]